MVGRNHPSQVWSIVQAGTCAELEGSPVLKQTLRKMAALALPVRIPHQWFFSLGNPPLCFCRYQMPWYSLIKVHPGLGPPQNMEVAAKWIIFKSVLSSHAGSCADRNPRAGLININVASGPRTGPHRQTGLRTQFNLNDSTIIKG